MGNITSKRSVEISSTPKKGVVADITAKDETNVVIEEKLGNGDAKVEDTKEEIKEIIKEETKEETKEEDTKDGGEEKGEGDSKETETDDKTEEEKKKESKATNIKKKLSFKKSFSFLKQSWIKYQLFNKQRMLLKFPKNTWS